MSKITSAMAVLGVVAGLGVAALPLSSYAATSAPVTIRAMVDSSIAVTAETEEVDLGTINGTSGDGVQSVNVTVSGSVAAYTLGVMDTDTDTNMNWVELGTATPSESGKGTITAIPAYAGTGALNGNWGFRIDDAQAGTTGTWNGVPALNAAGAATNIVSDGTLTAGTPAVTKVTFGANAGTLDLKNGIYEDQVVFTAASK